MELSQNTYAIEKTKTSEPSFSKFWATWCQITKNTAGEFSARHAFNNLFKAKAQLCSATYLIEKLTFQANEKQLKIQHGLFVTKWPSAATWLADKRFMDSALDLNQIKLLARFRG